MTQQELDSKIYDTKVYIADKFRDIQSQASALKNVEDESKVKQTLTKITDFAADIFRAYGTLEELFHEEPEMENEEEYDYAAV